MPNAETEKAEMAKMLAPDLPHVAYVLLWYPLFTQPFIFREVEELKEKLPLSVYTLYGPNMRHCSEEMKTASTQVNSMGAKFAGIAIMETVRAFCRQPALMFSLFRQCVIRKWPSLEVLGENLWAFFTGVVLARRFREAGIDMVYAPWPRGTATASYVAAKLAGLPFAMAARGDNLAPADPDLGDKINAALFVRANNAADQKRIQEFGAGQTGEKTVLVYNSLTLPRLKAGRASPGFTENHLRILAFGRFDVTKGFPVLLRSCAILKKQDLPFRLTLAGGGGRLMGLGDMEKQLVALRHELDLEAEVSMPGLISHDQLPQLLASHDLFVAPCVIDPAGRRDGIPNTLIEAMTFGLPVVSTDVNALPEVVRHGITGRLAKPDDPEALAREISWMWRNPDQALQMGRNAATLAADLFDSEANAMRLCDIFAEKYREFQGKCAE